MISPTPRTIVLIRPKPCRPQPVAPRPRRSRLPRHPTTRISFKLGLEAPRTRREWRVFSLDWNIKGQTLVARLPKRSSSLPTRQNQPKRTPNRELAPAQLLKVPEARNPYSPTQTVLDNRPIERWKACLQLCYHNVMGYHSGC